mmetsp:Transcript_108043/g.214632  ORF Transcript_108043/g.214632 Transcript_108043/m.214632 type:complete len:304 (-) Transcript_108043:118-1029(-)
MAYSLANSQWWQLTNLLLSMLWVSLTVSAERASGYKSTKASTLKQTDCDICPDDLEKKNVENECSQLGDGDLKSRAEEACNEDVSFFFANCDYEAASEIKQIPVKSCCAKTCCRLGHTNNVTCQPKNLGTLQRIGNVGSQDNHPKGIQSMAHAGFVLESGIVPGKLDDVWGHIHPMNFKFWKAVAQVSKVEGEDSLLGQYTIAFADHTVKTVRVTEMSERIPNKRSLGFEFISSEPPLGYSSRMDQITLSQVTHSTNGKSMVYVEYSSDFSNDAGMDAVQDSKYKKVDFLNDLAKFTAENCPQ